MDRQARHRRDEWRGGYGKASAQRQENPDTFQNVARECANERKHPGRSHRSSRPEVKEFIRLNTGDAAGDPYAKKMASLVPRFDATRDWTLAEAVALLDDIAAVTRYRWKTQSMTRRTTPSGRARHCRPSCRRHRGARQNQMGSGWRGCSNRVRNSIGSARALRSRILIHNAGQNTVVFRTCTWHQSARHKVRDGGGAEINIESADWTTIAPLMPFRLAPGEMIEVCAAGIGVGANKDDEDWQENRVGAWIEAREEDDVTFLPDSVPLSDWSEAPPRDGEPGWWPVFITERLHGDLPLPTAADERGLRLLDRVMRDLFGPPRLPTKRPHSPPTCHRLRLDSLARRLVHAPALDHSLAR